MTNGKSLDMDEFEKLLQKTLKYLSFRPRSEKEIHDYLTKKNTPPEIHNKIFSFLIENRLIGDVEFAKWWINQRMTFRMRGKRIIKLELLQKGISQEIIDEAFADADEPLASDLELAKNLVRKRLPRLKDLPVKTIYEKLSGFLARRGFGWETIKKSIDEVLGE